MLNIHDPSNFDNCCLVIKDIRNNSIKLDEKNAKSYRVTHQYDQCAETILKVFISKLIMNMLLKVASDSPAQRQDGYRSAELLVKIAEQLLKEDDYYFKQIKQCL